MPCLCYSSADVGETFRSWHAEGFVNLVLFMYICCVTCTDSVSIRLFATKLRFHISSCCNGCSCSRRNYECRHNRHPSKTHTMTPNNFTQALTLLTHIQKFPCSNVNRDTDCPGWCSSWFYSYALRIVTWNSPQPFPPQSFQYILVYLKTPSVVRTLWRRMLRWFVNENFEGNDLDLLTMLSQYLTGGTEKNQQKP
jgi:hypothetical protein